MDHCVKYICVCVLLNILVQIALHETCSSLNFPKGLKRAFAHGGHNKCGVDKCMEYRKTFASPSNLSSSLLKPQWKIC